MGKAGGRVQQSGRRAQPRTASATTSEPSPPPSAPSWTIAEAIWASGVGVLTLALYLSTFSSSVALGDGPESVSGIRSVGILHAPGYATYVLLARLWATVLPFGSWSFRVNLFSVVCATATIVLVFVLARLFGAGRFPAAIGAFTVATSISFWFNAGFAKHYALSGLIVTTAAVLVVSWERKGGTARLVAAGAVLGLGLGASWELTASMGVGLLAFVALSRRRPSAPEIVGALGAGAVIAAGLLGFVVVRAGQNPPINWGHATTLSSLTDLLRQKDFLGGTTSTPGGGVAQSPARAVTYMHITVQELGIAAIALAIIGAVYVYRRQRRNDTAFLGIVLLTNLIGAIFAGSASTGVNHDNGILTGMVVGGFLIDLVVVLGVLVALGTTWLGDLAATFTARGRDHASPATAGRTRAVVGGLIALAILVPSIIVHAPYATHRGPAYADDYARRVLDALPQNAVLLTLGWEFGQPIRYEQIVHGQRRDVAILSDAEAKLAWYRDELQHQWPTLAPTASLDYVEYLSQFLANAGAEHRRIFVDMSAIGEVSGSALKLDGVVAEVTSGSGLGVAQPIATASRALHDAQKTDGWLSGADRRFAEQSVSIFETRADVALAKVGAQDGELDTARVQLADAVAIRPDIRANRDALTLVQSNDPGALNAVLALTGAAS